MDKPARAVERAREIGDALLDAAVLVLAEEGWGGFTIASVSKRAGYSKRPAHNRYEDRSELACALWAQRVFPYLAGRLADLSSALDEGRKTGDSEPLERALIVFADRNPLLLAAGEVAIQGLFDKRLQQAVDEAFIPMISHLAWLEGEPAAAAQLAYGFAVALGLGLGSRLPNAEHVDFSAPLKRHAQAMLSDFTVADLPPLRARYLDEDLLLDDDNPAVNALLNSALTVLGERGFAASSVSMVSKAAGYTEGLAFANYKTKHELFFDAISRAHAYEQRAQADFYNMVRQQHGEPVALAVQYVELQYPGRDARRASMLEQLRLCWHFPELAEQFESPFSEGFAKSVDSPIFAEFLFDHCVLLGMAALPEVLRDCYKLPWNAVTVPLHEMQSADVLRRQSQ